MSVNQITERLELTKLKQEVKEKDRKGKKREKNKARKKEKKQHNGICDLPHAMSVNQTTERLQLQKLKQEAKKEKKWKFEKWFLLFFFYNLFS